MSHASEGAGAAGAISTFLGIVGSVLIAVGVAFDTTTKKDPSGFYVTGGGCLVAAGLLVVGFYLWWPWLVVLNRRRAREVAATAPMPSRQIGRAVSGARPKLVIDRAWFGIGSTFPEVTDQVRSRSWPTDSQSAPM